MRSVIEQDPDFQYLHKALNTPNLFNVLDNLAYEIRHSNFLAWILDPNGSHKQGDLFLNRFLDAIGEAKEVGEIFHIRREQDRIDILIISQFRVITIENKTFTTDSIDQLKRYRSQIQNKYSSLKQIFIYWTPNGDQPTDKHERVLWGGYSYTSFVSDFEPLLNNITDRRVTIYLSDYLESLKIKILSNSPYVDTAKILIERHKDYIGNVFSSANELDPLTKATYSFIERHSRYERGSGFFSTKKEYRSVFESICKLYQYQLSRSGDSQSTYFGFVPLELTSIIQAKEVCFEYYFRFMEKRNHLRLAFTLTPESPHNRKIRDVLRNNLHLYHDLKISTPTKSSGRNHIGVVHINIPFNPLAIILNSINEHIHDLFKHRVCGAVESINGVTRHLISGQ
jgi:hypothetical protein